MPPCETCGKENQLVLAEIEGVDLRVCPNCARYGKIKSSPGHYARARPVIKQEMPTLRVVPNIASILHQARQAKNMTQEDFAKFLSERESTVVKWENGTMQPDVDSATRMARLLGLGLVEKEESTPDKIETGKQPGELTIGDFVKVRKKKI